MIRGRKHVMYTNVGGGLEPGESFEEAAKRECEEKTGCDVELVPSPRSFIINDIGGELRVSEARGERALIICRKRVLGGKMLVSYNYLGKITEFRGRGAKCRRSCILRSKSFSSAEPRPSGRSSLKARN